MTALKMGSPHSGTPMYFHASEEGATGNDPHVILSILNKNTLP